MCPLDIWCSCWGPSPKVHICPPPCPPPTSRWWALHSDPAQAFQADKTETVVFFSFPAPAGVFTGLWSSYHRDKQQRENSDTNITDDWVLISDNLASIIRNREVLISADPVTRPRALSHVRANKYWYVLPYFRPRLLSLIIFGSEMPRGKICQYTTPTRVEPEPDLFSRYRLRVHLNLSISAIGRSLINRLRLPRILI